MTDVERFLPLAYSIAADYYTSTGEPDDIRQEALLAVCVAVRDFDPSRGVPLDAFVGYVVRRRVIAFVKGQNTGRARLLTFAERVRVSDTTGEVEAIVDTIPARSHGPGEVVEIRDRFERIADRARDLTPLERRVFEGSVLGLAWREMGVPEKSVDNALQRIRAKLRDAA